jgi:hypothetical protein
MKLTPGLEVSQMTGVNLTNIKKSSFYTNIFSSNNYKAELKLEKNYKKHFQMKKAASKHVGEIDTWSAKALTEAQN